MASRRSELATSSYASLTTRTRSVAVRSPINRDASTRTRSVASNLEQTRCLEYPSPEPKPLNQEFRVLIPTAKIIYSVAPASEREVHHPRSAKRDSNVGDLPIWFVGEKEKIGRT